MKKLLTTILLIAMFFTLLVPMSHAEEQENPYVPEETFTREELLAMDPELDSDGDGLSDVIELVYGFNRHDADTDSDGVTDYTEFCITCTDVLVPDGQIDTDGDGLTNAEEAFYGTNPDDLDTDNDNLGDYEEIMVLHTDPLVKNHAQQGTDSQFPDRLESGEINLPGNQPNAFDGPVIDDGGLGGNTTYNAALTTEYGRSYVSYQLIDGWFLNNSNTTYNNQLAVTSSLLSAIAYDEGYLSNTYTTDPNDALKDWFSKHGFTGFARYDLDYDASTNPNGFIDQHVSEMFIAHKTISNSNISKKLVCIVIRGTNGTLDEWQSNFDLGAASTPQSGWTNPNNHMGFDITSNRLNDKLSAYMSANGLTNSNSILWITGHSRGGALANLLAAKRCVTGQKVYAYTFAAPTTTTNTSANTATYNCIFNIINTDDFVPKLPLEDWNFFRYGTDKPESIENNYASQWDAMMTDANSYTSNKTKVENVVATLSGIAASRNACYTYRNDSSGYVDGLLVQVLPNTITSNYPEITSPFWRIDSEDALFSYRIYQQPAFFMQLLAANQGGVLGGISFGLIDVAPYLEDAKLKIVGMLIPNVIKEPHYCESYYLLSTLIP